MTTLLHIDTERGAVGLLAGKQAFVLATGGGRYHGTALDTQSTYVRDFLRFLGIDDVQFVYAEGLALGAGAKQVALAQAQVAIAAIGADQRLAA